MFIVGAYNTRWGSITSIIVCGYNERERASKNELYRKIFCRCCSGQSEVDDRTTATLSKIKEIDMSH